MKSYLFSILIILIATGNSLSQSIDLPGSIVVFKHEELGMVSKYNVKTKNTLYSIAKAYHTDLKSLIKSNPDLSLGNFNPGDSLLIPFHPNLIEFGEINSDARNYIPVYYKTVKKDNLFRIARHYFDRKLDLLMKINHFSTSSLKEGQLVLVGWKGKLDTKQASERIDKPDKNHQPDHQVEKIRRDEEAVFVKRIDVINGIQNEVMDSLKIEVKTPEIIDQKGLAIWNRDSKVSGIFALHDDAKPGTLIEILNPQLNRREFIKVIGKIPSNSYHPNVKVIVSPEAAKVLGALDPRFYVKMKYISN